MSELREVELRMDASILREVVRDLDWEVLERDVVKGYGWEVDGCSLVIQAPAGRQLGLKEGTLLYDNMYVSYARELITAYIEKVLEMEGYVVNKTREKDRTLIRVCA